MEDGIKKVLAKYNELAKLILDQKLDEMADQMEDVPADSDEMTYEQYLQNKVMAETDEQMSLMEDEEDELLDDMSMREYFVGLSIDELLEIQEYCALNLDGKQPKSLTEALVSKAEINEEVYDRLRTYAAKTIGDAAWTEDELGQVIDTIRAAGKAL